MKRKSTYPRALPFFLHRPIKCIGKRRIRLQFMIIQINFQRSHCYFTTNFSSYFWQKSRCFFLISQALFGLELTTHLNPRTLPRLHSRLKCIFIKTVNSKTILKYASSRLQISSCVDFSVTPTFLMHKEDFKKESCFDFIVSSTFLVKKCRSYRDNRKWFSSMLGLPLLESLLARPIRVSDDRWETASSPYHSIQLLLCLATSRQEKAELMAS